MIKRILGKWGGLREGHDANAERLNGASETRETQLPEPAGELLREWQNLVSLWDRMEDPRLFMHEAPSAFEITSPNREGWVLHRKSAGVLWEWRRQWAVFPLSALPHPDWPRVLPEALHCAWSVTSPRDGELLASLVSRLTEILSSADGQVLKRAHLLLYDRTDSASPTSWVLLRCCPTSACLHATK